MLYYSLFEGRKDVITLYDYIEVGGVSIDFFNHYKCDEILYDPNENELVFSFKKSSYANELGEKLLYNQVKIIFFSVFEYESAFNLSDNSKSIVLRNFTRGIVFEYSPLYKKHPDVNHFSLEFAEGQFLELFCIGGLIIFYDSRTTVKSIMKNS